MTSKSEPTLNRPPHNTYLIRRLVNVTLSKAACDTLRSKIRLDPASYNTHSLSHQTIIDIPNRRIIHLPNLATPSKFLDCSSPPTKQRVSRPAGARRRHGSSSTIISPVDHRLRTKKYLYAPCTRTHTEFNTMRKKRQKPRNRYIRDRSVNQSPASPVIAAPEPNYVYIYSQRSLSLCLGVAGRSGIYRGKRV